MRNPSSLKQEFLKKWIKGLQACTCSNNKYMTILDRKKAIKLSADLAMASTRNGTTYWSRAVITNATQDDDDSNRIIAEHILGRRGRPECVKSAVHNRSSTSSTTSLRSKKILKRITRRKRVSVSTQKVVANTYSIAKRLVQKKTRVLRSLVPGGESMDEMRLIAETLDYIVSLRAQVDVMRCLATTTELINGT